MVTISPHITSSATLPILYSEYRPRAQRSISFDTIPRFIDHEKNPSPASPDHSVPSQSKAATCGLSRRTLSRNSFFVSVSFVMMSFGPAGAICLQMLRRQRRVLFRRIDIAGRERIIHRYVSNLVLMRVFDFASIRCRRRSQKCFNHLATSQDRVSVFALVFRDDRPYRTRDD